jgi:hypothetical protein
MKTKKVILLVLSLSLTLLLSACSPKIVSEVKAKEAGLALINQVFDVNETEAETTLEIVSEETAENTTDGQADDAPSDYYTISVKDDSTGLEVYSAWVNAETGFATYATRSDSTLSPLTEEQLQEATELAKLPWSDESVEKKIYESKPQAVAYEWAEAHLNLGIPLRIVDELGMEGDLDATHRITMGYYAVFDDGVVYEISLSWPTMEIQNVFTLSKSIQ